MAWAHFLKNFWNNSKTLLTKSPYFRNLSKWQVRHKVEWRKIWGISGDGSPYSMERQPRQRSGTDIYHAIKENRPADPHRCLLGQQWQLRTQSLPACRLHPFPIPHPHRLLRPADQHSAPLIEQLPHHHPRLRILHALLADKVKNAAICFFSTPIPINRLPFRGMGVDFPYLGVSFRLFWLTLQGIID